jgi:hypothetical protein
MGRSSPLDRTFQCARCSAFPFVFWISQNLPQEVDERFVSLSEELRGQLAVSYAKRSERKLSQERRGPE